MIKNKPIISRANSRDEAPSPKYATPDALSFLEIEVGRIKAQLQQTQVECMVDYSGSCEDVAQINTNDYLNALRQKLHLLEKLLSERYVNIENKSCTVGFGSLITGTCSHNGDKPEVHRLFILGPVEVALVNCANDEFAYILGAINNPNVISYESPLAKALIGKQAEDSCVYEVKGDTNTFTILDVQQVTQQPAQN